MEKPKAKRVRIRDQTLRDFVAEILIGVGVPPGHARGVGDSLVAANLRGVDSHGVELLATYVGQLQAGGVDRLAFGTVAFETGSCLLYDGQNGLGQVVSERCVEHALRLVRVGGLALVVARNSHHFGAAAYWSEKLARAGCIGIVMSTAGPWVPPWPGKSPRIGTNPISMAVPGLPSGRWSLDMATTTVAKGKIAHAADLNMTEIPASWGFVDPEGHPTTDLRSAERGWSQPLGGYKGSGLGMMVEILCAGLSGGPMANEATSSRTGSEPLRISHMFLAIEPERFMKLGEFDARIGRLVSMMKSSDPIDGQSEILVAGEPEWRTEAQRRREGIPLPSRLWERLSAIARQLKVGPPKAEMLD
jgi:LDH2 family malate/lactate/ureidoglycolate dehydrogenase